MLGAYADEADHYKGAAFVVLSSFLLCLLLFTGPLAAGLCTPS
jgi:hypothetical protein